MEQYDGTEWNTTEYWALKGGQEEKGREGKGEGGFHLIFLSHHFIRFLLSSLLISTSTQGQIQYGGQERHQTKKEGHTTQRTGTYYVIQGKEIWNK